MSVYNLALQSKQNILNPMAAMIANKILEVRKEVIKESLRDFTNIEHRLEHVTTVHGIEFVNDSKATNVNSTWFALESMTKPVIWIAGGVDNGGDYTILSELAQSKVKAIVFMGLDNKRLKKALKGYRLTMVDTNSAEEAVQKAYYLGTKGDVVLMSPACASFDAFENFELRGQAFKNAVREL